MPPRKKKKESSKAASLPLELVMEILSWLPLKPLARAQLVCKEWPPEIRERCFMEKNMQRSSYICHWVHMPTEPPSFRCLYSCDGLLLMKKTTTASLKYFVWNPVTRLALPIPNPHSDSYGFAFSYVPATRSYKIVSIFWDRYSGKHGCQLLTIGRSMAWRRLTFPQVPTQNIRGTIVFPTGGAVVQCIILHRVGEEIVAEIASIDVESRLVMLNHQPSGEKFGDFLVEWDGKLAFAERVEQEMQLMVLQDHKNTRWVGKKEAIPLRLLTGAEGKLLPLFNIKGETWYWMKTANILVSKHEWFAITDSKMYGYKPSLVTFEGMRADDELQPYRPHDLLLD